MFLVIVSVLMLAWFAVFRFRRRRMYQLANKFAGSPELPFIGHLHYFAGDTEDIMNSILRFTMESIENGGIQKVWLGSKLLFIMTDPVDVEYVLKYCLEKDDVHRFFRDIIGNGVVFAPVDIWKVRRKVMVPAFSPKIVDNFVEVFSEQSHILVKQIDKHANTGTFDAWPYVSSYTLDSVSGTVMGANINAQTTNNSRIVKSLNVMMNMTSERVFHIWQHVDFLFKLAPRYKIYQEERNFLFNFTNNVIASKRKELETTEKTTKGNDDSYDIDAYHTKTFLELLIQNSSKSKGYSDTELREEVLTLTVAGTDTSAVSTSITLILLGQNQEIQERVYQELLDIYGNTDRPLVKEDLSKMVYLDRVIKESLRLYPAAPILVRKIEEEVTLPSGKILPKGSGAVISLWGVHRDPKYWGENAEEFDPDRFSPERYENNKPCAYIPFSAGPRNCIGYQYATNSIKTSISSILRRYRVIAADNVNSKHIPIKFDVIMKAVHGYNIALESRKPMKPQTGETKL